MNDSTKSHHVFRHGLIKNRIRNEMGHQLSDLGARKSAGAFIATVRNANKIIVAHADTTRIALRELKLSKAAPETPAVLYDGQRNAQRCP
jgi:hypothetical protein